MYFPSKTINSVFVCFLLGVTSLAGCKTDAEKAEEKRLNDLFASDNYQVAKSLQSFSDNDSASYRAIRQECVKEREHNTVNGKWCLKFAAIEKENKAINLGQK